MATFPLSVKFNRARTSRDMQTIKSDNLPALPERSYELNEFNLVARRLRSQARSVATSLGVTIRPKRGEGKPLRFSGWTMSYKGISTDIKAGDNLAELKRSLAETSDGIISN